MITIPKTLKNLTSNLKAGGPLIQAALIGLTIEQAGENLNQVVRNRKALKEGTIVLDTSWLTDMSDAEGAELLKMTLAELPSPVELFGVETYRNILSICDDREQLMNVADTLDEEAKAVLIYYVVHCFDQNGSRINLTSPADRAATDCILMAQKLTHRARTSQTAPPDLTIFYPDNADGLMPALTSTYESYQESARLKSKVLAAMDLCFIIRTYETIFMAQKLSVIV